MNRLAPTVVLASVLILSGCGSSRDLLDRLGAAAPTETAAAQFRRSADILDRMDSSVVLGVQYEVDIEPDGGEDADITRSRCSGTRCNLGFEPLSQTDLQDDSGVPAEAVLTHHGITTVRLNSDILTSYGAWMNHAGFFAVQGPRLQIDGRTVDIGGEYGIAGGDLTGNAPSGRMTWTGVMVGSTPRSGDLPGNILHGTAELSYSPTSDLGGTLDASFRDIHDLGTNGRYASSLPGFTGVPVDSSGTFEDGDPGNRIQGGFYGPGHAEAAGVFEQSGVIGAFGARRN